MADRMPRFTSVGALGVNGVFLPVTTKTGNYTATPGDQIILCNGTFTVTLPAAADCLEEGRSDSFIIINIGSGVVTIDGNASENINGATTLLLSKQYVGVEIHTDGSNWFSKGPNMPQAAEAALTFGTDVTAATANGSLEDSAATNPSKVNFDNNMKELGTKINNLLTKLVNAGILAP